MQRNDFWQMRSRTPIINTSYYFLTAVYHCEILTTCTTILCTQISATLTDPGPHGSGRYSQQMLPEVEKKFFRKGAQWFTMKRQHAVIVMADNLYYTKFRDYYKTLYCWHPENKKKPFMMHYVSDGPW